MVFLEYHDIDGLDYLPLPERPPRPLRSPEGGNPQRGDTVFLMAGLGMPKRFWLWERYQIARVEYDREGTYLEPGHAVPYEPPLPMNLAEFLPDASPVAGEVDIPSLLPLAGSPLWDQDILQRLHSLKEQHHTQDPDAFWTEMLRLRPEDGDAWRCRGLLRARRGAKEDALADLMQFAEYGSCIPSPAVIRSGVRQSRAGQGKRAAGTGAGRPQTDPASLWRAHEAIAKHAGKRHGQQRFHDGVFAAYAGRCAVTGFAIPRMLHAAHIVEYCETRNQEVHNGILLRVDIHTLFDLHLLRVRPDTYEILLQPEVQGIEYAPVGGKRLAVPKRLASCPDFRDALIWRWKVAHASQPPAGP